MGDFTMPCELDAVWKAGAAVPETIHDCIHKFVAPMFERQPEAPAVCAWDGSLTYGELDVLSSKLAQRLVNLGVSPGDIVSLCFEKSMWTPVAMMAVAKAGAGFLLLDRFLPEERLRVIVQKSRSKIIMASLANIGLTLRLPHQTVVSVGPALAEDSGPPLSPNHPTPEPSSIVYVVFTSGSTGVPKGCVISHENLCSALHHQVQKLGFQPSERVFDFASYSFDISIHNLFTTLVVGGCLCIPNDADRNNDLAGAITQLQATFVELTPTVARLLRPETVPTLQTLVLLGEQVTEQDSRTWWGKTRLVNAYGPTECTSFSTLNHDASTPSALRTIGVGRGALTWIVDAEDHHTLLPWGETGELLLEGPIVGLGYLNDPERSAAVFVQDPAWLVQGGAGVAGRRGTLYKTGDLARYDDHGNITLVGRKDTQVKIRGNRVELGEVECQVQNCMQEATQVVAEPILLTGSTGAPVLAAFLKIPGASKAGSELTLLSISNSANDEFAKRLPAYMVPSLFFVVSELPLTLTGKTDRNALRKLGASFSAEQVALETAAQTSDTEPHTAAEEALQTLWARVLNLDKEKIRVEHDFLRLGGDSIAAMQLVGEARKVGIKLTVADVFRRPVLAEMARLETAEPGQPQNRASVKILLDPDFKAAFLSNMDKSNFAIQSQDVEEILPITDAQESFILEGVWEGRQFVDYYYLDLGPRVNLAKLEQSCGQLLHTYSILRASFLPYQGKHWAVIPKHLDTPFSITDVDSDLEVALADFCHHNIATFSRNSPIVKFVVLRNKTQGTRLIVRLSHAQYDAISISIIFASLIDFYHNRQASVTSSFSDYLAHLATQRPHSIAYWKQLLKGAAYTEISSRFLPRPLPATPPVHYRLENAIPAPRTPAGITAASFMAAAWAVLLSQLLGGADEVVYARLVNGRNAAVPGVEGVVGACINMVPVRLRLSAHRTVGELAGAVQEQFVAMGEADSLGFLDVVEQCTDWPAGNRIYTCVQHQNVDEDLVFGVEGYEGRLRRFENVRRLPVFLYMLSVPRGEGRLGVQFFAHTHMMERETAQGLLDGFCGMVGRLVAGVEQW